MGHVLHAPRAYLLQLALLSLLVALVVYLTFLYLRKLYFRAHPYPPQQATRDMAPNVDLAVVFRAGSSLLDKAKMKDEAKEAQEQYSKLVQTLKEGGLQAVGRRGVKQDQVVVLVWCPQEKLNGLVQQERYSDFLYGLSTTNLASVADASAAANLAPADRLRLVHGYVTSTRQEGGLGVITDLPEWNRVEAVMALHDHDFNHEWIRAWTTSRVDEVQLDRIRDQFGESVALYFSFVSAYGKALVVPSALGIAAYFFGTPYSALYSTALCLWSITFVEWWRIRERILSVRWSTRGSFRVERRRAQYIEGTSSLTRELRTAASVPVILLFAGILGALLTSLFVFEAFVTNLYRGPGHEHIGLAPMVLFMALVPRFLALYQGAAVRLTKWENHAHHSTHEASLTLKTFALGAIVAYLNLALSAFVYVPFGADVMRFVQVYLFKRADQPVVSHVHGAAEAFATAADQAGLNDTAGSANPLDKSLWEVDAQNAQMKLNPSRLQDQMYAYTVTNQVIGMFLEVGLPFIMRGISSLTGGSKAKSSSKKKRVGFEDEQPIGTGSVVDGREEREMLERVRAEVALPEYTLFADYSEMVTQFGYVALWSTIWPLAPAMSFLNNMLELRSDAYKITVHQRRPVPSRTDTIGPWLEALAFLSWAGALSNAALVYLFHPETNARATALRHEHPHTADVLGGPQPRTPRQLLVSAGMLALVASHGVIAARVLIRHALERALWKNATLVKRADSADRQVKENYMRSLGVTLDGARAAGADGGAVAPSAFWETDEGLDEIRKALKDE